MSRTDSERWDQRYRLGEFPGPDPDRFLLECRPLIDELLPARGRALDIAGGAGRNAIWAAKLGFDVTLVDSSEEGLARARAATQQLETGGVHCLHRDLTQGEFAPAAGSADLLMVFFYLDRKIVPDLLAAVRPGGLAIHRTYLTGRPARHPEYLLNHNELLSWFSAWRVLRYEETSGENPTAALAALKL